VTIIGVHCALRTQISQSINIATLHTTDVLRGFAERMHAHEKDLTESVIKLLHNCPPDAIQCRKELLVATRHILATEFRRGFFER
jgi:hypothetical protein